MKKFLPMKWLVLLAAFFVLGACGGGGSNASTANTVNSVGGGTGGVAGDWFGDTMSITVKSPSGTTTTSYNSNETNPVMFTEAPSGYNVTLTTMDTSAINILISTGGESPGTYPVSALSAVSYIVKGSPNTVFGTDATGTITITSIGAVNQPITGSFQVVVSEKSPISDPNNKLDISGTFSITRRM